jgi:hypothetical protein
MNGIHVAYTRLQPGAAIVLIETRWHEDDSAGRLLREHADEDWVVLSLPAIAEVDESFRRAGEALWLQAYLDELAAFPTGVHDDVVDSTTQALNYLREQSDCLGVVEYLKREAAPQATGSTKPPTSDIQCCPQCGATTCIVRLSGEWRCNQ